MPVIDRENVLKGLTVQDAMRKLVIELPANSPVEQAIRYIIKYKVNAILITNENREGIGVVSKTDLMGAYYAGLPIETPVDSIMVASPLFCHREDSLDAALNTMRSKGIHRLYVLDKTPNQAVGVLAYPDIVGLLYRYCHKCNRSIFKAQNLPSDPNSLDRFKVREVMTPAVRTHGEDEDLFQVMEGLAAYRFGAVLIEGKRGFPVGVLSKTDLIIAYKHGISPDVRVKTVMNAPVRSCDQNELMVIAVQKMIFSDIHRLFVHQDNPENIVGVLTLTDAARVRSGSCRACMTSRIEVAKGL